VAGIICKRCQASDYVKNGVVRGLQRYRCKRCGCNFTATQPRGKPPAMKALTILLYGMGNMSYRMIARLLGVSHVSIYEWIRAEAEKLPEPQMQADVELVTLDEMHHFLKKRAKNSGSGERLILFSGELYPGCWGAVMMQPAKGFSIRSA
jgi:transposase-like protein